MMYHDSNLPPHHHHHHHHHAPPPPPHDHFHRRGNPQTSPAIKSEALRGSYPGPSHHMCTNHAGGSFKHNPACPHTPNAPFQHGYPQVQQDHFQNFPGDLCRGLADSRNVYPDMVGPNSHGMHPETHIDSFLRHPSPQDSQEAPVHGLHHHHHHHSQQSAQHSRHVNANHRNSLERPNNHRSNAHNRGMLETHREYDSDDPLFEEPTPNHALRHHRSVPDMYAILKNEESPPKHHQHSYGTGCRLRRQQSLSKETSMSGTSANSDPPSVPSSSRRTAGLQRQHSLGQDMPPRNCDHDLEECKPNAQSPHQMHNLHRSQSSAQDLSRSGSVSFLNSSDIRRSRSALQDVCRSNRTNEEKQHAVQHAHSAHDLPISHSPRTPRRNCAGESYQDPHHVSSGGSSASPPMPHNLSDTEVVYPLHLAHCELSRSQQLHNSQRQQHAPFFPMNVPPPPPPSARVSLVEIFLP